MRRRITIVFMSLLFVIGFSVCSFADIVYYDDFSDFLWVGEVEPIYVDYEDSENEDIYGEAEILSLESSNPDVIKIGGYRYAFADYGLHAKKPGKSIVTLVYKTETGTETVTKEVRVKKYPNPIKSLKVNGKKVKVSKNKYEYEKEGFKGTKVTAKLTPKKGWKIVDAHYSKWDKNLNAKYTFKGVKTKLKKGSEIKLEKKYKHFFIDVTMRNTKGEELRYVIRLHR